MNSKRFWGTVMAACLTVSLLAQQHKSVIPYKLVGQKMIIEMLVNGSPAHLCSTQADGTH